MTGTGRPHRGATQVLPLLIAAILVAALPASPPPAWAAAPVPAVAGSPTAVAAEDLTGGDPFGEHTPVLVVMDTSGSMEEDSGVRGTRIQAARAATLDLVGALRVGHPFGLVSYPGGSDVSGCTTGVVQHPVSSLDPIVASAAVRRLSPDGDTPTGPALNHARQLLEAAGYVHGTIVLVSDGEANCGRGPCAVAKSIRDAGFDVVVNTVGFAVNGQAEDELTCVADATGGTYISVTDEQGLTDALASAATAHLSVSVNAPDALTIAAGDVAADPSAAGTFEVLVGSDGRFPAADTRVTLALNAGPGISNGVLVPTPVRFLGNLAPGQQRTVPITTRPDQAYDDVTWTVTVTARNARPVRLTGRLGVEDTLDRAKLGPLFDDVDRVAVVGDSYSSGEGAGDYESSTPSRCHRSFNQYAAQLWGKDATTLIACSGAVTSDFWRRQRHDGEDGSADPQLSALRNVATGSNSPQAVFVSIGGNDAGFGDWGFWCAAFTACAPLHATPGGPVLSITAMLEAALGVQQDVFRVIRAIDAAVNDQEALAARDGQVAPIVVVPYPRIMPRAGTGVGSCFYGFSAGELNAVNQFLDALNDAVALAAYQWRNGEGRRRPIYVAEPIIESFQPDHTVCEGEGTGSWARTFTKDMGNINDLRTMPAEEKQELLHPNTEGHKAMARAIVAWSNTPGARPVTPANAALDYDALAQDVADPQWWTTALEWLPAVMWPEGWLMDVSGDATLHATGFGPGVEVVVSLQSTTTTLGTARADAGGAVDLTVRVPRWVEPGTHHVRFFGPGPDRGMREVRQEVRVASRGTRAWLLLGAGGLLLLACASLRLRGGRRPSTPAAGDGSG